MEGKYGEKMARQDSKTRSSFLLHPHWSIAQTLGRDKISKPRAIPVTQFLTLPLSQQPLNLFRRFSFR
jgi:hypothetical protein